MRNETFNEYTVLEQTHLTLHNIAITQCIKFNDELNTVICSWIMQISRILLTNFLCMCVVPCATGARVILGYYISKFLLCLCSSSPGRLPSGAGWAAAGPWHSPHQDRRRLWPRCHDRHRTAWQDQRQLPRRPQQHRVPRSDGYDDVGLQSVSLMPLFHQGSLSPCLISKQFFVWPGKLIYNQEPVMSGGGIIVTTI